MASGTRYYRAFLTRLTSPVECREVAVRLKGARVAPDSKGFTLTWYRALTWYFHCVSSLRMHLEPRIAVGTRRGGSLAAW